MIHPTAIVSPEAVVAESAEIGPYCVVHAGAEVGEGCVLESHVVVHCGAVLGPRVRAKAFVALGGDPQDLSFDRNLKTGIEIGEGCTFHEGCTIHRATHAEKPTRIGSFCLFMANSHVAHDCTVGNHVIFANGALIGGHVRVEDFAFISGNSVVHQGCRVGESVMLSGNSSVSMDIPPFCIASGRNALHGLNIVGLRRRKIPAENIQQIKACYFKLYNTQGSLAKLSQAEIESNPNLCPQALQFLQFFSGAHRGILHPAKKDSQNWQ